MTPETIPTDCPVFFCHLRQQPLESALPKLLLKTLQRGWRASVCLPDQSRIEQLSEALWAQPHEWILPHGFAQTVHPEHQPIWLETTLSRPNAAEAVFLCGGCWQNPLEIPQGIQRLCLMIEPNDPEATDHARILWKSTNPEHRTLLKL